MGTPYVTPSLPDVAGAVSLSTERPIDDRMMTRLPVVNMPWPPPEYNPVSYMMRIWDAWWCGDRQKLAWCYYNLGANSPYGRAFFSTTGEPGMPMPRPGQFRGGLLGSIEYSFWGLPVPPGEKRTRSHVPIASDIAQTSASLLFAKPPILKSTLDGKQAIINNAYFETLLDDKLHSKLLEAAEMCSALGGVYLRVVWDRDIADAPWIMPVPADIAIPEFSYDKLAAVTFWRIIQQDDSTTVRHLEKHVPSQNTILHGVYTGDETDLGEIVPLTDFPQTARFAGDLTTGDAIYFPDQPFDASSVVYVPNMTPNRIWRDLGPQAWPLGRSDYSGVENLMDNLDEVYTSWIRDVRLAKSRIIVPPEFLDNIGKGKGAVWEPERQVYTPLNMLHDDKPNDLVMNQFAIRWQEHKETCHDLVNRIVQEAGYSPQTFGDYAGNAPTATEINARERISMMTRGKKINYWRPALADIIYGLMTIERVYFGNTAIEPERPSVEFVDTVSPDISQLASTANALVQADAVSKQTLVQFVHPDWTPEQVNEEVTRMLQEIGSDIARRARTTIQAPLGTPIQDTIDALVQSAPVPPLPADVPGTSEEQNITGEQGNSDVS